MHRPSGNGKSRRMSIGEGSEDGHDELGVRPQHEVAQEGRRVRHFRDWTTSPGTVRQSGTGCAHRM